MKSFVVSCLYSACLSIVLLVSLPISALADYGSRPNSTTITHYDWDPNRIMITISDEKLVFNIYLERQQDEYFMGEYNQYRVMYDHINHSITVIDYTNGEEIYNYNFYEVDSQVDEGAL